MKDFFRKNGKKLIAVLCSLTLVISCFQGIGSLMPEVNASDEYTEITLSDLGVADNSLKAYNSVTGNLPGSLTSWNKVRVTGCYTLEKKDSAAGDDMTLQFGGDSDTENWTNPYGTSKGLTLHAQASGMALRYCYSSQGATEVKYDEFITDADLDAAGIEHMGQEFTMSVSILYQTNDAFLVTVEITQGANSLTKEQTFTTGASNLSTNFALASWAADQTIAYRSVVEYKDLLLTDLGVADNSLKAYNSVTGNLPGSLTSWNKVRVTGCYTLEKKDSAAGDDMTLQFGGDSDTENWTNPYGTSKGLTLHAQASGMALRYCYSSQGATEVKYDEFITDADLDAAGIEHMGQEFTMSVSILYQTNDAFLVTVEITQGANSFIKEQTFQAGASNLSKNFALASWGNGQTVVYRSVVEYTELMLSDLGVTDGSVTAYGSVTGNLPSGQTSWNKIKMTGSYMLQKVDSTAGDDMTLQFGGDSSTDQWNNPNGTSKGLTLHAQASGMALRYCYSSQGAAEVKYDSFITDAELNTAGIEHMGQEFTMSVSILYQKNDAFLVTVTIEQGNKNLTKEQTFTSGAGNLSTNFALASWGNGQTVVYRSVVEYIDIDFSSFGISSQVVGAGQKASGSLASGETLHGKHFTGRYRFSTGGDGYLGFGGSTSQNDSQGISLWTDGNGGLWARCWAGATKISGDGVQIAKATLSESGIDLSDTVIVECWIEYVNNDNINVKWKLSDTEGDSYEKELSYSYTGITGMLSTTLITASSATANSEIEPAEPTTYTDINFASFGILSQVVGAGQKASGSLAGGETLHGKHFTGRYKFSTGGDGYLGFGGSTSQNDSQGISLWTDGTGGLWARCWAGATKISGDGVQITKATLSESGIDLSDTVIVECWIEYANNDNINVTWKLSDTEGDSYEKELSYSYTGITGMLSTTLIVASSAGTNSEIEPAEPTTYTDIDFASFNIPSQVVGAGQTVYGGLANDETLHGKHFTGRYRFSTGADGYIGFGGSTLTLDSQGISLWTDGDGGLLARCWVATKKIHDGEAISKAVLSENGIDLSKEVTVELWIEYKDTNNVNVTWKLSDEDGDSYEKDFSYTYEGITDLLSTYLIVTSSSTTDSEIEPEQPVAEGKTIVTFYDFDYIEDMTMSAGTENAAEHIKGQANCIENFDNVTFKGTVSYETNATLSIPVLLFGGEKDSEQWTNINGAEKGFYLQLYDNGYVKMGVQRGTVNSVYTIGTAFTSGTSIDLQINFAYDEDDLRVTVYLTQGDTTIEHTARFKGAAAAIGTSTWLVAAPYGAKMTIASAYTRDVTKSDDVYMLDLKNPKAYLLTGKEITVNGISKTAGDTLSESGEYTIVYMKNGVKYTQKVSIFALGDLDTNASIIDGNLKDVVDSKTLVKIKKYVKDGTPTSSTQRAADLTNDEVVDDADAAFLRKVLVGLMELDEYYPASLSYEFIGGSDVMPISGYYGPYAKDGYDYITGDVYKTMQDANINLVVSSPMDYLDGAESNQSLRKALALGEKYKIGMYVLDSRLNQIVPTGNTLTNTNSGEGYGDTYAEMERVSYVKTAQEAANYFTNYSYFDSYLGNFAKDEPCTDTFPATGISPINTGNHIDWYGDVASILNNYSNSFGYMNAQCYSGRCKEKNVNLGTYYENTSVELYTEYLNEMLTKSQIPMLSFDNYMYADGVDGEKRTVANTNTWLVNLDTVRTVAKSNETGREVPFWTYVAAGGYFDGSTETIENTDDIMTQAQFNWQVNVPLAFGTKGLTYFPLIQPSDFANADDKDNNLTRNGMINTEYETTKWYTYAQAINKQVTAIDHVLMKADSKGVIISEGTTSNAYKNMVNISYKRYGTSYYREYSVQNYTLEAYKESDPQGRVTKFTSSDTTNGAIAGVFSYQGKTAYYVVNWSDANTNNVTLTFDKASNYTVIQNAEESTGSGDTCQLSLAAGEGVLVVLNN